MSTSQESVEVRLERALQSRAPELNVKRISSVERLTGGLSSQSFRVSVETEGGPSTWVMRVEPKHGTIKPYSMAREYNLIRAVGKGGVPVPDALYLDEDESVVGGRFMLMSFVQGEIYSQADPRLEADPELKKSVQRQFVEALAQIHDVSQDVLPMYADGAEAARAQVAVCRARLEEAELLPCPVFRHALDVLDREAPEAQKLSLLHGDFRLPNLMFREGKLRAILDWELARVGDPLGDIAFTQTTGAGICAIEGELARYYTEITGIEIDERQMIYHKLLEGTKAAIIGLSGASAVAEGGTDLRQLSVAVMSLMGGQTRLRDLEAQLEEFLEA